MRGSLVAEVEALETASLSRGTEKERYCWVLLSVSAEVGSIVDTFFGLS